MIASTRTAVQLAHSALNPQTVSITRKRSWKTITVFTIDGQVNAQR